MRVIEQRVMVVSSPAAVILASPPPRPSQLVMGVGGTPPITGYARETTLEQVLAQLVEVVGALQSTLTVDTGLSLAGLATGAQQLPDDHRVRVSNLPVSYPLPVAQADALAQQATLVEVRQSLAQVIQGLSDIFGAVDGLEVTAGNIEINSETLNLNTDGVEQHLREIRDRLTAVLGQASRSTSLGVALSVEDVQLLTALLGRLPAALVGGRLATADDYVADALTEDQPGADAVLEFTTGPLALVAVDVDASDPQDEASYLCRATVDGSAPTASRGWRCRSGQTTYLPVPCAAGTVRVWAPAGVTVSVQGGVRGP